MNRKCKKLKRVKRIIESQKSDILVRPQFSKHPVSWRKEIKKFHHTSPPIKIDATGEVLLGSAIAGPAGALIGVGSATLRTLGHMGTTTLETIRERAEETRRLEKKKPTAERTA